MDADRKAAHNSMVFGSSASKPKASTFDFSNPSPGSFNRKVYGDQAIQESGM